MTASQPKTNPTPTARPFTPRPKLFVALGVIFAAWVGFMIWMYVATVYPLRHGTNAPADTTHARAESQ